jgi:hypothetical protein
LSTSGHWLIDTSMGDAFMIDEENEEPFQESLYENIALDKQSPTVVLCDLETMSSGAFR